MASVPRPTAAWTPPPARVNGERLLAARAAEQRAAEALAKAEELEAKASQEDLALKEEVRNLKEQITALKQDLPKIIPGGGGGKRTIAKVLARDFPDLAIRHYLRPASVSIPTDFATLNDLFEDLRPRRIRAPLTVTVKAGNHDHAAAAIWDHPDAHMVTFSGEYSAVTIASVGAITSNSAFSHDIELNLTSAAGVQVGHWVFIGAEAIANRAERCLAGTWRVLAVAGNKVTIRHTDAMTSFPAIAATNISAEVHMSRMRWDSSLTSGLVLKDVSSGKWSRIVFDGQFDVASGIGSDTAGIGVVAKTWVHTALGLDGDHQIGRSTGTFRQCSFVRWKYNGLGAYGLGHFDINNCNVCSNAWRGDQTGNGTASIIGKSCVISGNRKSGSSYENGGSINHNNSTISGNGEQGLYGIGGGDGIATGATILRNQQNGVDVRDAGYWDISNAVLRDNTSYQVIVDGPAASVRIDSIDTAGAGTSALRAVNDGVIYARTNDPTIAETSAFSFPANKPGRIILPGHSAPLSSAIAISSATSPNGGFALTTTSAGDMAIGRRTSAAGTSTIMARFAASEFRPETDDSYSIGRSANRWKTGYIITLRPGDGTVTWTAGPNSPEGSVTAVPGSLYLRTNGGAGTTFYVKETGTGNTGWVAK